MKNNRRAILGVFLVLIGGLLLLDNLNLIPDLPDELFSWPVLLIALGVFNLFTGNRSAAIILLAVGGIFYIQKFTYYHLDFRTWWPAILVIVGLAFILRKRIANSTSSEVKDKMFDELTLFGGNSKRITSQDLQGGRITTFFGGSEIDLRDATVVDGATIEVMTAFGGVDIIVPPHWEIIMDITPILGGFDDKREPSKDKSNYKVFIKGTVILGGGDIKTSK